MPTMPPHDGQVVALTANMSDALIAYLIGPRHVQRVPREHGPVLVSQNGGPYRSRPSTDADRAEIQESITEFLASVGIPAPPASEEWRLFLPAGISERDVRDAVDGPTVPAYTETNGREVVAEISRRLNRLFGPLD